MLRRNVVGAPQRYGAPLVISSRHIASGVLRSTGADGGSVGAGVYGMSAGTLSGNHHSPLAIQRRYSLRYTTKAQLVEMSQPSWLHDKRHGIFSYERHIAGNRRATNRVAAMDKTHMNLWATDTDATNNRFMRPYFNLQKEYHTLLGRPHYLETDHVDRRLGLSTYEMNTDMRFKGTDRSAMTNSHYESGWNQVLYRHGAHGSLLSNPDSALTRHILGDELLQLRDVKGKVECKAWWDRLAYLIDVHHAAVGDIGAYKSRNIQHVHRFFVAFHEAISSFEFQDRYLADFLATTRPKELDDVFGIFIEMEANYVNRDYCPRCSLPYATTKYCGEGDPLTPFRKHRGRWAPHQQWGKEWDDVVCRRAEALWYRSTEDNLFGGALHTQRQVEALMNVYHKTKQRGKAISFMTNLRGSREFITGQVVVTPRLQHLYDGILDSTPHPHLLTNGFKTEAGSSVYLAGEVHKVPQSPQQLRLDLEMNKFRRMQKEEGVVRLPPKGWSIDMKALVPYKVENGQITNWRAVKAGIEASFLSTGLRPEAYTKDEWREMYYLTDLIAREDTVRAKAAAELEAEQQALGTDGFVFPDAVGYRCFNISSSALKPFGGFAHGARIRARCKTFENPRHVTATTGAKQTIAFDASEATLKCFGVRHGDVLSISGGPDGLPANTEVVVVGVEIGGGHPRELLGATVDDMDSLIPLGKDILDMRGRWSHIGRSARPVVVPYALKTATEEFEGAVVGVRKGVLYCQWGQNVATPVGPDWSLTLNSSSSGGDALVEPFSWATPFRNQWATERLEELRRAPWQRESWVSLIPGKYTPKRKPFGYTQHTTQDDFVTKEYKDRLTSKQYFKNPNAFEVIPDATNASVNFGPKQECIRLQGLPTVDRNELENGWNKTDVMSDLEMREVEQCLRDISGNRPGNFIKSPTETASLSLNESWWTPLEFGWEQHNREQNLLDNSERKLKDGASLPFGGKIPAFGTSYGIGERTREIAEDYGKGFGLGPHLHAPGADKVHFNTLGFEDERVATLGYGNLLVRMFNEKLGNDDEHQLVLDHCGSREEMHVKKILLQLREWREFGRPPAASLRVFLRDFLKDEIASYNQDLPDTVPRLSLDATPAVLTPTTDNVWSSTDKVSYALEQLKIKGTGDHAMSSAEAGVVPSVVLRAQLQAVRSLDENFVQHLQATVLSNFQRDLSAVANAHIDPKHLIAIAGGKSGSGGSNRGREAVANPMIASTALDALLLRYGIAREERSAVLLMLSQHVESDTKEPGRFVIPASVVLTWRGDGGTRGQSQDHARKRQFGAAAANAAAQHSAGSRSMDYSKPLDEIIKQLPLLNDGLAMDVQYATREHRKNAALRNEFATVCAGLKDAASSSSTAAATASDMERRYERYVSGRLVPNVQQMVELFCDFLMRSAKSRALAAKYFVLDDAGKLVDIRQVPEDPTEAAAIKAFVFENVRGEVRRTEEMLREARIPTNVDEQSVCLAASGKLTFAIAGNMSKPSFVWAPLTDAIAPLKTALEVSRPHLDPKVFGNLLAHPDTVGLRCMEHLIRRSLPLLGFYQRILRTFAATAQSNRLEASQSFQALSNILQHERSSVLDIEFRRNAERYWKNVLDGRGLDELSNARGGVGGGGNRRGAEGRRSSNMLDVSAAGSVGGRFPNTAGRGDSAAPNRRTPASTGVRQQEHSSGGLRGGSAGPPSSRAGAVGAALGSAVSGKGGASSPLRASSGGSSSSPPNRGGSRHHQQQPGGQGGAAGLRPRGK